MTHDQIHEQRIRDALCGDLDPRSGEFADQLAGCADCRERWGALERAEGDLATAGAALRADLQHAAAATDAEARQVEEMLVRAAEARTTPRRAPPWLLAAAALLLVSVTAFVTLKLADDGGADPVPMGDGLECLAPVGEVAEFGAFRWRGALPPSGWFELVVEDAAGNEVLRSGRLSEPRFVPTQAQLAELPAEIRWQVFARDVGGVREHGAARAARP